MRTSPHIPASFACLTLTAAIAISGCNSDPGGDNASAPVESHQHPTEGPHHGSLIELGNEQHHAELVHDEQAGTVTVYLLDSEAKAASPTNAAEVTLNLTHEGQPEQFALAANPEATDPAGSSSRFASSDPELLDELEHAHGEGQLVVMIDGQQFRGALPRLDHEGDEHEEHEH